MSAKPDDATMASEAAVRSSQGAGDARVVAPSGDVLVVAEGANAGTRYEVGNRVVTAGRQVTSDLFLDDVTVSRAHAELFRDDAGRVVVRDVGSLNGTYVNRVRVDEAVLESGDEVQIGKFKLVFVATAEQR